MFSTEEKFYFTLCELMYIDEELITEEENKCVENAITVLENHLDSGEYDLNEDEINIIASATQVCEVLP